jgi:hypothetical protein
MIAAMGGPQVPVEPEKPVTPPREEQVDLTKNADIRAINVGNLLQSYKRINVVTTDGNWVGSFELPKGVPEGSVLHFTRTAGYATDIISQEYGIDTPQYGETRTYTFTNGVWTSDAITLSKNSELRAIGDKQDGLNKYFRTPITLTLVLSDGNWTGNIYLPTTASEGSIVKLVRNSGYATNLFVNGKANVIARGTSVMYHFKAGAWAPYTMDMTYASVLQALANSPETFKKQLLEAQKINAVIQIKP